MNFSFNLKRTLFGVDEQRTLLFCLILLVGILSQVTHKSVAVSFVD